MVLETGIVQEETKSLQSYFPFADVFVTIHPRAQWPLGVVQVKEFKSLQTDYLIKERESAIIGFRGAQVIAGSKGMGGIEADSETVSVLRLPQNEGELLESGAQICALPGSGFYEYGYGASC